MKHITIGFFTANGKTYNIRVRRGRNNDNHHFYIGNDACGEFFRMKKDDNYIGIKAKRGYDIKLFIQPNESDLFHIINMIFPALGYGLLSLTEPSRKAVMERVLVEMI